MKNHENGPNGTKPPKNHISTRKTRNFQRYVVLIVNAGGLPDFRDRLPKLPKLAGSSKTCVNFWIVCAITSVVNILLSIIQSLIALIVLKILSLSSLGPAIEFNSTNKSLAFMYFDFVILWTGVLWKCIGKGGKLSKMGLVLTWNDLKHWKTTQITLLT